MRHLQSKKQTAWKKSRTFGDLKGGRMRVKLKDNILRKLHSLQCPSPLDECPIYMQENPSKDFYIVYRYWEIKISKNNKLMIGKKKPTNRQLTWYKG